MDENDGAATKYYAIAGMTVAMKDAGGVKYLLTDHLGSVDAITDASGALLSQQRYMPFGEVRTLCPPEPPTCDPASPVTQTDFGYIGQRDVQSLGLMDYKARFYDPGLGRFIQPDTIIPNAEDPQNWNRFSYVVNNPANHRDPTGHQLLLEIIIPVIVLVGTVAVLTIAYESLTPHHQLAIDGASTDVSNAVVRSVNGLTGAYWNRMRNWEQSIRSLNPKDPIKNCTSSSAARQLCVAGVFIIVGLVLAAVRYGGCGATSSNSICPPPPTVTPEPTGGSTVTIGPACPPNATCLLQAPGSSGPTPPATEEHSSDDHLPPVVPVPTGGQHLQIPF